MSRSMAASAGAGLAWGTWAWLSGNVVEFRNSPREAATQPFGSRDPGQWQQVGKDTRFARARSKRA